MTLREIRTKAYELVYIRHGKDPSHVGPLLADADKHMALDPLTEHLLDKPPPLRPGVTEQDLIEGFVHMFEQVLALPPEGREAVVAEAEARMKRSLNRN